MRSVGGIVLVLLCACSRRSEEAQIPVGDQLALGTAVETGNLTVWPVFSEVRLEVAPFRTLEEAQERGDVVVREQDQAEVDTLVIENRGEVAILACAGTVLVGGRQDRQLGQDIVVEAKSSTPVKAFCVEQNRWSGGEELKAIDLKASRPVRAAGQYDGDQGLVWYDVEVAQVAVVDDESGSYRAVTGSRERRRSQVAKVLEHLRAQEGNLVGYAYAIDGSARGMRTFMDRALLEPRLEGFVRAICLEAEQEDVVKTQRSGSHTPSQRNEEHVKRNLVLRIHPVADLTLGLTDFIPPQITQVGVDEDSEVPLFGGQAEEAPQSPSTASERQPAKRSRVDLPTLIRALNAAQEQITDTTGANRNGYRTTKAGNHSTCYVRTKDGRWVPLTRDWTAR